MALFDRTKTYNVYTSQKGAAEDTKFLQEGFSVFAFILPFIWSLYNRVWALAAILLVVNIGLATFGKEGFLSEAELGVLQLGVAFYVGFEANDWYGEALKKKGYKLEAIIVARNLLEAQHRFFGGTNGGANRPSAILDYATL